MEDFSLFGTKAQIYQYGKAKAPMQLVFFRRLFEESEIEGLNDDDKITFSLSCNGVDLDFNEVFDFILSDYNRYNVFNLSYEGKVKAFEETYNCKNYISKTKVELEKCIVKATKDLQLVQELIKHTIN